MEPVELFEEASRYLVGGVNSPVRAFYKPYPLIVERGEGPYIYDVRGKRLLDHILGYGPLILGHRHPVVYDRIKDALENGWLFGALTREEVKLAEKILSHIYPGGLIRFVNSGTEATMLAIRLARGYTGRSKILKFDGCYHGAHDHVLVKAGSAASHLGVPTSDGVPRELASLTIVGSYNNVSALEDVFRKHGEEIAAVIVEPVIGNYGVIEPKKDFLQALRTLTREYGSLLIFDEVITGFRLSLGGAQEYFGVKADLVALGKIIGGGFPIGAVAGRREVMEHLTPKGRVFNAGTFNGHPISMAAGIATIQVLEKEGLDKANSVARAIMEVLDEALGKKHETYSIVRVASMLQFYIGVDEVESPNDVRRADKKRFLKIHEELAKNGVLIAPSQMEAIFTSITHGDEELQLFQKALGEALRKVD